jgi:RNA polymerase-binding transcription factor DksA
MPLDLVAIRAQLEAKRAELQAELGGLTEVPRDPMAAVSFGKRIGEGTAEAVERLNTTGAARQLAAMLSDVERALAKFDDGTYGICDRCGATIPDERLEARPWSVLCVRCSALR